MKVSIITVCYNSSATILDALRSVASQSYWDVEHIIIDGASTDDTLDLVRQNGHRVAVLVSEPDGGIYDAMNKGLQLATGEMVGFLNSDDMLADPYVIRDIVQIVSELKLDVIYGDLNYVKKAQTTQLLRRWRSGSFSSSSLKFGWMPPHPTLYVRRSTLQATGGFNTRFRISADYDLILRLFKSCGINIGYLPRTLVLMRAGGASNRSVKGMISKSFEDLSALKANNVGGILALLCKNLRKLPQFFVRGPAADY